ncbi:DNA-binding transcriptional MocR family regulator [Halanaerobium saccharolyticum]|uniref:DNA-binding transcriptional MocR family regulator n=1 Tax=Halanaerobium saccharolyticum TaxID=43595 RepID=A0A4R6M0G3_9FIRM|nr:PLP-dependent aminotransferase family protein [Halanaerobium saccharolyticum]TDO94667.1 DNA-binding transcriptional MocR family regulator [Halanaerobium saccharolyticum]
MLEIKLDEDSRSALYLQLYKKLKDKIKNELKVDTKLPPIRKMAAEVNVNPATVVKAYDMLAEEQLIYKKVGSGSFVAPEKKSSYSENREDMLKHGQIKLSESINFASAAPSTDLFPVADFKYAINQVLERDQGEAFTYQKSQGFLPLRKSIKKYFEEQGINSSLKQIQVVSGAQQAIDIISKILLDYRDQIIVEDPTYFGALQAFNSRRAEIKSIKMEQDGADLEEMEIYLQKNKIKFFFTMQNFQNPTGVNWSREKQRQLLELAEKYNFYIIEDDILSDLNYDQNRINNLKEFDEQGRVIYIKSFSKVFMPGLRLAFIILPEKLLPEVLEAKYATDISSGGLTQRAFDYYLREGLLDKHISFQRNLFQKRYQLMREQIIGHLPEEIKITFGIKGGLYFWLNLPQDQDTQALYEIAVQKGLVFSPGHLFSASKRYSNYLRLSFAAVDEKQIKRGIRILKDSYYNYRGEELNDDYSPLL